MTFIVETDYSEQELYAKRGSSDIPGTPLAIVQIMIKIGGEVKCQPHRQTRVGCKGNWGH